MCHERIMAELARDRGEDEARETPFVPLGTATPDRLLSLDFIRGIAVLGILAANIAGYALSNVEAGWPSVLGPVDPGSQAVWAINLIVIDGKMRSLFAILFGAGLALFIDRVDERGGVGMGLQMRRLAWLFGFGIAHFYLLYRGDILATYAFWGFFAAFMVRARPVLLLSIAASLYLVIVPLDAANYGAALEAGEGVAAKAYDYDDLRERALSDRRAFAEGSFVETVRHRHFVHGYNHFASALDALFDSFPMMLVGIAFYRLGLFARGVGARRLAIWGWTLAGVGIAMGAAFALPPLQTGLAIETSGFWAHALMPLQRVPMTCAWLFLLLAYLPLLAGGPVGQRIVAAGRMAFSNYIGTSLLMALIFQGWGLGLFGELTRLQLVGAVLLGWTAMLAWSRPWLERFRQGPLEWLWRCLTYWRLFPIRR